MMDLPVTPTSPGRCADFSARCGDLVRPTVGSLAATSLALSALSPPPPSSRDNDDDPEPPTSDVANPHSLSPKKTHDDDDNPYSSAASTSATSATSRHPPPMSLPEVGKWATFFIPSEFRRSCGLRPNYVIVRPGPNERGFADSMRGFGEAMESAAPPNRKRDVSIGGCYAARVPGFAVVTGSFDSGLEKTWVRVVATGYEGAGRWHAYCADLGVWSVETVGLDDIRFLPDEYRAMPFQAILADLAVDPVDERSGKYSAAAFKFLNEELKGASSLNICVGEILERPDAWPRVKMTLTSLVKEDERECIVGAMVKRNLVRLRPRE